MKQMTWVKRFAVLFIDLIIYYTVKLDLSCSSCNFTEGNDNLTSADVTKCLKTHSPMSPCEKTLGTRFSCCRFYVGRVPVVVQFYPWCKFYFSLFWGMVMYGNEFKTKGKRLNNNIYMYTWYTMSVLIIRK